MCLSPWSHFSPCCEASTFAILCSWGHGVGGRACCVLWAALKNRAIHFHRQKAAYPNLPYPNLRPGTEQGWESWWPFLDVLQIGACKIQVLCHFSWVTLHWHFLEHNWHDLYSKPSTHDFLLLMSEILHQLIGSYPTIYRILYMWCSISSIKSMSTLITGFIDAKQSVRAVGEAQTQPAVRPVATRHNYKKVKWRKNPQRRTGETMLSTRKNPLKISDAINIPDSTWGG